MRKRDIVEYILDTVNQRSDKQHNLNKEDVDAVLVAFRDAMLLSVSKCEEFMYFNFLECSSKVIKQVNRKNPKDQSGLPDTYRIRSSINFMFRCNKTIKNMEITEEAIENTKKRFGDIKVVGESKKA